MDQPPAGEEARPAVSDVLDPHIVREDPPAQGRLRSLGEIDRPHADANSVRQPVVEGTANGAVSGHEGPMVEGIALYLTDPAGTRQRRIGLVRPYWMARPVWKS